MTQTDEQTESELTRMDELSMKMDKFIEWQKTAAKESARLKEKVEKAERYMGMEHTETKPECYQVPELTDEAIMEMVEHIRKRPELKEQNAIKDGIIHVMGSDFTKKTFKGYAHNNTSDWLKFSRVVLDKVKEYDYGHAVLILGDHRMDDWISENHVLYERIQCTYYQIVVDMCTEEMRDSIKALE